MNRSDSNSPRIKPSPRTTFWFGMVLFGITLGFAWHAWKFEFTQDDAFISLRYARNLVDGHGLVFNVGERVEGYSNFSWTLLLALFLKLGAPAVTSAAVLGTLCGALAILVAVRMCVALEGRLGTTSLVAGLLVASNSAFALWSTSGLETSLFVLFVTWGLERGFSPGVGPKGRLLAPVFFFLASLTRPEGPLFFALWFGFRLWDRLRGEREAPNTRQLVTEVAAFAAPALLYGVWKYAYFGDLLPNTYYAKAGLSSAYLTRGMEYAGSYFRAYGFWGITPLLAALALTHRGGHRVEVRLGIVALVYATYVVWIGGDVLRPHRFWLTTVPLVAVLIARGLQWSAERLPNRKVSESIVAAGGVAMATILLWMNWQPIQERRAQEAGFVENMAEVGEWLQANLPRDALIATTTIGALSYHTTQPVLDMLGLTDREIARDPQFLPGVTDTWREIKYNAGSVLARRPEAILFSTGLRPSAAAEKALYAYPQFYDDYFVQTFHATAEHPTSRTMFRRRPDARGAEPVPRQHDDFGYVTEFSQAILEHRMSGKTSSPERFREVFEQSDEKLRWARDEWVLHSASPRDPRSEVGLQSIVTENPFAGAVQLGIVDHWIERGDLQGAAEKLEHVLNFNESDPTVWATLAVVRGRLQDFEGAFVAAAQANQRCNVKPAFLALLGQSALFAGRLDVAERAWSRQASIDPSQAAQVASRLDLVRKVRSGQFTLNADGSLTPTSP